MLQMDGELFSPRSVIAAVSPMAFRPPTDPHEPNEPRETTDSPKQEAAGKQRGSPLLAISFVITLTGG